ncbi:hypothetical protein PENSPDRAFT_682054 [Peniophora sp. CONT]|nr:hypothetical protein PENSPDRAFT_682054 [Peniophora sp. CONT]
MSSRIEDIINSNSSHRDPAAPLDEFAPLRRAGKCIIKIVKQRDAFAQERDEVMQRNMELTEELAAASAKVHLLQQMLRDYYAPALSLAQSLFPGTASQTALASVQDEHYVQASVPDSPVFTPPPDIVQYSYPSPASTELASPEGWNAVLNPRHQPDRGSSDDNMRGLPLLGGFLHTRRIRGSNGNADSTVPADPCLNLYLSSVGSSIDFPSQIGDDDTDDPESPTAGPAAMFGEGVRASRVSRMTMAQDDEGVHGSRLSGSDVDEVMMDGEADGDGEYADDEGGSDDGEEAWLE